jgi:hypothetical protein
MTVKAIAFSVRRAAADRFTGNCPLAFRTLTAATHAGEATAAITYRGSRAINDG